jgi:hypothetical protein
MDVQKLAKVLAMAASDNDAEAMHALRTAGRLLDNAGLDFVALAERLAASDEVAPDSRREDLEDAIFDLRNELRHLRAENERLRQAPAQAVPPVAAPNLANAAQDAAQVIRLRAELDCARQELVRANSEAEARETALRADLGQAIEVAERLTRQFSQIKGRSDRLDAENRRLSLVAAALKAEMDERVADRLHPLPPSKPEPFLRSEPPPRRAAQPPARRSKTPPPGQYALF